MKIDKRMFKKSPAELEAYMAFKHRGGRKPPKKGKGAYNRKKVKGVNKNDYL